MKRFWKYIFILLMVLCIFAPSGFVHADPPATGAGSQACTNATNAANAAAAADNPNNKPPPTPAQDTAWRNAIEAQATACNQSIQDAATQNFNNAFNASTGANNTCGILNIGPCFMSLFAHIASFILTMMAWLLWLAGAGLDWVLNYTITNMSANISQMTGINIVWKVIRDLSNIAFIFILLYEAILLIISRSDTAKIKGIIAGIVITALLINFSMFFTKVIIDASNVVTLGFYQSIVGAALPPAASASGALVVPPGISGAFINDLHVVNFMTGVDPTTMNASGNADNKSIIMLGIGGSILFLVLAFVFFAVAIMYLVRYIVLVVLLMSAPLGYLGIGLPTLKSTQTTWWNTLLGQCIFAPLWMFCCWAILMLVGSQGFLTIGGGATNLASVSASGSLSTLFSGSNGQAAPSGIPLLVNFGLIIGLVIGSLSLAKKKASEGSGLISSWTGKATAFAGGAVMGGAAVAGRNTIGRAANAASNSEWLKDKAATNVFARTALKASNKTANSTFDARNTKAVGQTTGALGMNIGKGTKDTLRTVQKAKAEKEAKFAETLKPSEAKMAEAEAAKLKAEGLNKMKGQMEANMKTDEFKKRQKDKLEKHLNSDDYKKTDIYKNAEKEKADNEAKLKPETDKDAQLAKELKDLEEKEKTTPDAAGKFMVGKEIEAKKKEQEEHKKKIEEVEKEIAKNNSAAKAEKEYKEKWRSAEKIGLDNDIENLKKDIGASTDKENEIKNLYATRAKAYADNLEGSQHNTIKYAAAIGGGVVAATIGSPILTAATAGYLGYRAYTKGDRKVAADKVRKVAKAKTVEQEAKDLLKKMRKEAKERGEKFDDEEEKPPENTQASPTTPTNPTT